MQRDGFGDRSFRVVLICVSIPHRPARIAATTVLSVAAVLIAGCLQWLGPKESAAYAEVANTRTYWFLNNWEWHEIFGLVAPPAVLAILTIFRRDDENAFAKTLAAMAAICGGLAVAVVVMFVRRQAASYDLAMLQPLRVYQAIYAVMFLAIGALLAERVLKSSAARWVAFFLGVGGGMLLVQLRTFPSSAHMELPGRPTANAWEEGFEWARLNTDRDALFALDSNYITANGEDSQNFRAIAERSSLPDFAKDGGIASIAPALTTEWVNGAKVQKGLNDGIDPEQVLRLRTIGVNWVVVLATAPTILPCPFTNGVVKVCKVSAE